MRILITPVCLILLLRALAFGQDPHSLQSTEGRAKAALEARVSFFDVRDAILRDGLSDLSLKNVDGLHLGFEEIIRDGIQDDARALSTHFSLHLENKSVRQILDALCQSDPRYTWSEDAASINVYPRAAKQDPSYLLNLRIDRIAVADIPDPDQALTHHFLNFFPRAAGRLFWSRVGRQYLLRVVDGGFRASDGAAVHKQDSGASGIADLMGLGRGPSGEDVHVLKGRFPDSSRGRKKITTLPGAFAATQLRVLYRRLGPMVLAFHL